MFHDISLLTLFLLGITGCLYTALVIKHEKNFYLRNARKSTFSTYLFSLPPWWTLICETPTSLEFQRTDTAYDWKVLFEWCSLGTSLEKDLWEKISERKIILDPSCDNTQHPAVKFQDRDTRERVQEVIRIEGTGTQDQDTRIYLDVVALRDERKEGFLVFWNQSSVLSGSIEGPYFEEVLKGMSLDCEKK